MIYNYYLSYDETTDEFYGLVDENVDDSQAKCAFEIYNTEEIIDLIASKHMSHIDDVTGLEVYLKSQGLLGVDDSIHPLVRAVF